MRRRGDAGQASLELLGLLPLLLIGVFAALQIAFTVSAVQSTTTAARAAARAKSVGDSASVAARAAVPGWVAGRLDVDDYGSDPQKAVSVRTTIPIILPLRWLPHGPTVTRRAWFPPERH